MSVAKGRWEEQSRNEREAESLSTAEWNIKKCFSHANFSAGVPSRETKADKKPSLNAVGKRTKKELMRGTLMLTSKTWGQQKALIKQKKWMQEIDADTCIYIKRGRRINLNI